MTDSHSPNFQAFLSLGFRPLYIAGCAWALISVAIWIFAPELIPAPFNGLSWHAHEMLWGFIVTIAVGFLLTASATWTKHNPLKGAPLGVACLLWCVARIAYLTGGETLFWIGAASETAFFLLGAISLMRVVIKGHSRRNYGIPWLLFGLAAINLLYLGAVLEGDYGTLIARFNLGLICMAVIVLLIARRVVPFFSMRMVPGLQIPMQVRSGQAQMVLSVLAIALGLFNQSRLMALALLVTGIVSLVQVVRWKPFAVLHKPMLWILYLGYTLTGLGLILAAIHISGMAGGVLARAATHVHVIGMGGFAILIIGMVTRTALGHLGRPLALDASMLVSYYFMMAAVLLRIMALWPTAYARSFLDAAALAWIVCLGLYLWRFVPMLIRPRV